MFQTSSFGCIFYSCYRSKAPEIESIFRIVERTFPKPASPPTLQLSSGSATPSSLSEYSLSTEGVGGAGSTEHLSELDQGGESASNQATEKEVACSTEHLSELDQGCEGSSSQATERGAASGSSAHLSDENTKGMKRKFTSDEDDGDLTNKKTKD